MIIDIHGHYTTAPKQLGAWRERQIASAGRPFTEELKISDDEIRESVANGQLRLQQERGSDVTLFSPTAGGMAHHYGDEETSRQWSRTANDLIHRVCTVFPDNFIGVCPHTASMSSDAASRSTASSAAISTRIHRTATGLVLRSRTDRFTRCTKR
jgi:4-oxalmesaconate hydratase